MKMKTLHNPTDANIENYRIAELEMDKSGEPIRLQDGTFKETGRTLEWSIGPGETLEFPEYVADYLVEIYEFLDEVKVKETVRENEVQEADPNGKLSCKICGAHMQGIRGLAMHMAHSHPDELLK